MSLRVELYLNTAGFLLHIPIAENFKNSHRTKLESVPRNLSVCGPLLLRKFLCFAMGKLLEKFFQVLCIKAMALLKRKNFLDLVAFKTTACS
jgi:hypothetical protein